MLRINDSNFGHYIVKYNGELNANITTNLANFDSITKYQIINDKLLLAQARMIEYKELIVLLKNIGQADSFVVDSVVNNVLDGLQLLSKKALAKYDDFKKIGAFS